ncbi:MAG: hypothetical protein V2B16_16325 [bacterium]
MPNPKTFSLTQNYPNPFNPITTIKYSIPTSNIVILKVYDVLGIEINTLVNELKNPGTLKYILMLLNFLQELIFIDLKPEHGARRKNYC